MIQPLALVLYEKLMPGTQLVNRLQDLKYRVQTVGDAGMLVECAEQAKPMIVLADLESSKNNVPAALRRLRETPSTAHLPVIAYGAENDQALQDAARSLQQVILASEPALLNHLPQLLEQALQVE